MTKRDTEGAIEDMRLARSYLDDWANNKGDHVLGLAAKYIEQASEKDPDAKLTVPIDKDETLILTQDQLAADVLLYQSRGLSNPDAPRKDIRRAAELLQTALDYDPSSIHIRRRLAEAHLNLHDRDTALGVAKEAVAARPKDLDARKLLDYVESAPVTRPPSPVSGVTLITLAMVAFVIFGFIALFTGAFGAAFGWWVVAAIVGGIGRFMESDQMFKKALEEQDRDRADGR